MKDIFLYIWSNESYRQMGVQVVSELVI